MSKLTHCLNYGIQAQNLARDYRSFTVNTPYGSLSLMARSTGEALTTARELTNDRSCPMVATFDADWEI